MGRRHRLDNRKGAEKWPLGVAVGKLNVVFADNKEPRLVLDSTVCQVNTRCYLPERLSLPMASDLALATQAGDAPGASIDFKAAHKQIQVRPDEHGLLLFASKADYITIGSAMAGVFRPTGGSAQALSCCARSTACSRGSRTKHSCLWMIFYAPCSVPKRQRCWALFFCALAAPIFWKKAQFQDCLVWCGWEINFAHDPIQLMQTKLVMFEELIAALLGKRKVLCKTLEQRIGLLVWATSVALHLRSWMAPLYANLRSPPGSMRSIQPQLWPASRKSLNKDLKMSIGLPSLWLSAGSKILEVAGSAVHCLDDIPRIPSTSKPTWVRIADPNNPFTTLSKASQACLQWLGSCLKHSPIQPLAKQPRLQALAAADA